MKIIGFTGTRQGMTHAQVVMVTHLVRELQPSEVHHGVCIGADAEFHLIVRREIPGCKIVGHPGPDGVMQARRAKGNCDVLLAPKDYLARNRDIVEAAIDGMIATPHTEPLPIQGGTAYTVRHSMKRCRNTLIVWPNGGFSVNINFRTT